MKQVIKAVLWVVLGIVFLSAGGSRLLNPDVHVERFAHWGYPLWFLYLTGGIEVVSGAFLLIPRARLYGVLLLSVTMIGAFLTHLRAGEMGALPIPLILLLLLLFLAWTMRPSKIKPSETSSS